MKLTTLFEATQDEICEDYILANILFGNLPHNLREGFAEFYLKFKGKPKLAKYFLERKLDPQTRINFMHENKDDLKRTKVKNGIFDATYGLGFTLYIYDFAGAPPFKFKEGVEVYDFTVFNNCSSLTEFPDWFPSNISSYQQVGTSIKSFKNIHKVIESCGSLYFGVNEVIKNVSYLAEIKNLNDIEFSGHPELTRSVNNYLKVTAPEDRDALSLQSHLIDDDFETFA